MNGPWRRAPWVLLCLAGCASGVEPSREARGLAGVGTYNDQFVVLYNNAWFAAKYDGSWNIDNNVAATPKDVSAAETDTTATDCECAPEDCQDVCGTA